MLSRGASVYSLSRARNRPELGQKSRGSDDGVPSGVSSQSRHSPATGAGATFGARLDIGLTAILADQRQKIDAAARHHIVH